MHSWFEVLTANIKGFTADVELLNFYVKGDGMWVQFLIKNEHIIMVLLIVWTMLFINMSYDTVQRILFNNTYYLFLLYNFIV